MPAIHQNSQCWLACPWLRKLLLSFCNTFAQAPKIRHPSSVKTREHIYWNRVARSRLSAAILGQSGWSFDGSLGMLSNLRSLSSCRSGGTRCLRASTDFGRNRSHEEGVCGEHGPLTDISLVASEQQATWNLLAGAIGLFKNPTSHRTAAIEKPEDAVALVISTWGGSWLP